MPLCLTQGQDDLGNPASCSDETADPFAITDAPLLVEELEGGAWPDIWVSAASRQPHAAAQASNEQVEGRCRADRRPRKVVRPKRPGGRQAPALQVRLLMVCCSLACWTKLVCLLLAFAKEIAWQAIMVF